jgi:F0F1-type ATP synthase delta subunit
MNDTKKLINKVKAIGDQVDRMNNTLRTQELRRIMKSQPKTHTEKVDIVDALRMIANDINPAGLR